MSYSRRRMARGCERAYKETIGQTLETRSQAEGDAPL
jgi:hypothetical protein